MQLPAEKQEKRALPHRLTVAYIEGREDVRTPDGQ